MVRIHIFIWRGFYWVWGRGFVLCVDNQDSNGHYAMCEIFSGIF